MLTGGAAGVRAAGLPPGRDGTTRRHQGCQRPGRPVPGAESCTIDKDFGGTGPAAQEVLRRERTASSRRSSRPRALVTTESRRPGRRPGGDAASAGARQAGRRPDARAWAWGGRALVQRARADPARRGRRDRLRGRVERVLAVGDERPDASPPSGSRSAPPLLVTLVNVVMGTIIAWVLVRDRFPGKRVLEFFIDIPFALPTIVAGLVLLSLYGPKQPDRREHREHPHGGLLAFAFVTLPFVVRAVQPVLAELDREVEEAAASLGAGRFTVFRRIILPTLAPAIAAGAALSFARASASTARWCCCRATCPTARRSRRCASSPSSRATASTTRARSPWCCWSSRWWSSSSSMLLRRRVARHG